MGAKINLFRRQFTQFSEELLAVLHVGVIRLVSSEEAPDRLQFAARLRRINADRYCK